jgi:hypothetical protein
MARGRRLLAFMLVCGVVHVGHVGFVTHGAHAAEPTSDDEEPGAARVSASAQHAAGVLQTRRAAEAHERRHLGWTLLVPGVALVAGAGVFWWLSARNDDDIRDGLPSIQAYEDAQARGQYENGLAWAFGVAGLVGIGIGLPLVLTPDPAAPGLAVSGTW